MRKERGGNTRRNYGGRDAIHYLLVNGLAKGITFLLMLNGCLNSETGDK